MSVLDVSIESGAVEQLIDLRVKMRQLEAEVIRLRSGHETAIVVAWKTAFDLQAEHVNTWRDKAEWYWLARFTEEVGELAGALVGNHVGPVEWELSQIAAIALNWLDMRANRAAKEGR